MTAEVNARVVRRALSARVLRRAMLRRVGLAEAGQEAELGLAAAGDGVLALCGDGQAVHAWNVAQERGKPMALTALGRVANLSGLCAIASAGAGDNKALVAAYENGLVRVLALGEGKANKEFVLHVQPATAVTVTGRPGGEQLVWILYEDKVLVRVPFASLLEAPSWSELEQTKVWRLRGQEKTLGFAAVPLQAQYHRPERLFSDAEPLDSYAILTVGVRPAWALFAVDAAAATEGSSALGALATSVASKIGGSVLALAKSWVMPSLSAAAVTGSDEADEAAHTLARDEEEASEEADDVRSARALDPLLHAEAAEAAAEAAAEPAEAGQNRRKKQAPREKALRVRHAIYDSASRVLCGTVNGQDPSGRYCVTTDQLGRATLIDTCGLRIVKVWKGYRDAQSSWLSWPEKWAGQWQEAGGDRQEQEGTDGATRWGQYLALLAPWRQTLQIWRVPGCVLVASLRLKDCAPGRVLLTSSVDAQGRASSMLVQQREPGNLEVSALELTLDALERLFTRLDVDQSQQHSFLEHQFRRSLARGQADKALEVFAQADEPDLALQMLRLLDSHTPTPRGLGPKEQLTLLDHAASLVEAGAPEAALLATRRDLVVLYQRLALSRDALDALAADPTLATGALDGITSLEDTPEHVLSAPRLRAMDLATLLKLFGGSFARRRAAGRSGALGEWAALPQARRGGCEHLSEQLRGELGELLFRPLLADGFALPRVEAAASKLALSLSEQSDLLVRWWFGTPVALLVDVVEAHANPLSRLVQGLLRSPEDADAAMDDLVLRVLHACRNTTRLYHAVALLDALGADDPRVLSLRKRTSDAIFLAARLGAAAKGLSVAALDADLPWGLLIARAVEDGVSAQALDDVAQRFPVQDAQGREAVACHRVLLRCRAAAGAAAAAAAAAPQRHSEDCEDGTGLAEELDRLEHSLAPLAQVSGLLRAGLARRAWRELVAGCLRTVLEQPASTASAPQARALCERADAVLAAAETPDASAEAVEEAEEWPAVRDPVVLQLEEEGAAPAPRLAEQRLALRAAQAELQIAMHGPEAASDSVPLGERLSRLFPTRPAGASALLSENVLAEDQDQAAADVAPPADTEGELVDARRMQLTQKLLRTEPNEGRASYALAEAFGLDADRVRQDHTQLLYSRGCDTEAEAVLARVQGREEVGMMLLAVARTRMAGILGGMQENPKRRHLLAVMSADTSRWIRAAAPGARGDDGASAASSLSGTLILLRKVQDLLPASHPARPRAVDMTRAADALWRRVQELRV